MNHKFNVTELVRQMRERKLGATHVELFNALRSEILQNREFKLLLAEVGGECLRQNKRPIDALALAMLYGMELGVLLERDRAERRHEEIVRNTSGYEQ